MLPRLRLNYLGSVLGLLGYLVALSPSLMPRPALFMGVVAGVGFALWYGVGVLVSRFIRNRKLLAEPKPIIKKRAWLLLLGGLPVFIITSTALAQYWHNDQHTLLGLEPISNLSGLEIFVVAVVVSAVLFLLQRGLSLVYRFLRQQVARLTFLPPRLIPILAAVLAAIIIVSSLTGVLQRTAVVSINAAYSSANNVDDPDFPQPTSSLRSGSSESLATWSGLGREGRRFIASGPDAQAITNFSKEQAQEPIRVYAGINNAESLQDRVNLIVKELERTGAFDRKILLIAIPTGSGWVERQTIAGFEYMHNGNTAVVAAQYSFLPSGLSLFLDRGNAVAMGKELLHAVEGKLKTLPAESRPKLALYGLSLGSFGGQADFTGESDLASRLDAALLVGTPGFSEPWRTITNQRDSGSPQVAPIYNNAKVIKFATSSDDLINDINPQYKIVYYQYATDPFVWFDGRLLYAKPDWMKEAPGRDVSKHLRWVPVVTFAQIAVDQMFSYISGNNGHDYADDTVAAMAAATKPDNWSAQKSRALQELLLTQDIK